MEPLSPLAHPVRDDSPTVGWREWLAGGRPVAGAAAASGLLLAVCSGFVIHEGASWRGHGADGPTSVPLRAAPLDETRQSQTTGASAHAGVPAQAGKGHAISRSTGTGPIASGAPNPGSRSGSRDPAAPSPAADTPSNDGAPQPQTPVATPAASVPSVTTPTVTTPTVTAPAATVPSVTVPSGTTP